MIYCIKCRELSVLRIIIQGYFLLQFVNDVCQQLIELFRSKRKQLCLVVLEYIPPLIWRYLSSKSKVTYNGTLIISANLKLIVFKYFIQLLE